MTSDIEKMILEKETTTNELSYAQNKAYELYKEMWKFLLNIKEEDFDLIKINFSYHLDNNYGYIYKSNDITYTKITNDTFTQYHNYYEGCACHYINLLFNTNIDMRLFFKLIRMDEFECSRLHDDNLVVVCIEIPKHQIEKRINETLLKNKLLKLEKQELYDRINK